MGITASVPRKTDVPSSRPSTFYRSAWTDHDQAGRRIRDSWPQQVKTGGGPQQFQVSLVGVSLLGRTPQNTLRGGLRALIARPGCQTKTRRKGHKIRKEPALSRHFKTTPGGALGRSIVRAHPSATPAQDHRRRPAQPPAIAPAQLGTRLPEGDDVGPSPAAGDMPADS